MVRGRIQAPPDSESAAVEYDLSWVSKEIVDRPDRTILKLPLGLSSNGPADADPPRPASSENLPCQAGESESAFPFGGPCASS